MNTHDNMIKQLITDIAYDNVKLSQALTRAKILENKIKNDTFKKWLNKELEGYEITDTYLPTYRKVWSEITLKAEFSFGQSQQIQVNLPESLGAEILDILNHHRITEPISTVEQQIVSFNNPSGSLPLPQKIVEMLSDFYKDSMDRYNGIIKSGYRQIFKAQYQNVLEQTKQKLLDTLMELEDEFPNLLSDQKMSNEDNEKVQNIITNHIYGGNNPMNIAAGNTVTQNVTSTTMKSEDEVQLKSLGVDQKFIDELKQILETNSNDRTSLVGNSMKWLGNVTASVVASGLYENIPAITEFIHKLII